MSDWLPQEVHTTLKEVIAAEAPDAKVAAEHEATLLYVSALSAHLINVRDFAPDTWKEKVCCRPLIDFSFGSSTQSCAWRNMQWYGALRRACRFSRG